MTLKTCAIVCRPLWVCENSNSIKPFPASLCYLCMSLQLSILDQTPIRRGSNAAAALQESIELVRLADEWGYTRYWLSEHHNTITLAGAAPEVLIARLAAESKRIRLGSGGIMLPNHSTLKVAENFKCWRHYIRNGLTLVWGAHREATV